MAKTLSGSKPSRTKSGIFVTRVRVCGARESFKLPTCRTPEAAAERAAQIATLAERMTLARVESDVAIAGLRRVAIAPSGAKLKTQCALVDELVAGWRPESKCPTLETIVTQWASGELARLYPHDVRKRANAASALANLRKYVLPKLGATPVDSITLDACDEIANSLGHLRANSRRQVLAPLKTLLDYAVKPLKLIERSPLPARWLPREGDTRTLQWLYPSEDAQLMACTAVPLWQRLLFGYLIREGGRENEPLAMTIGQFDFIAGRNTARLETAQTKTRQARLWQLAPGTARALQRWVALRDAKPGDRMFVNGSGQRIVTKTVKLPELLRAALKLAGVQRPELFVTTDDSRQICVHDLRRSFVTVSLAVGRSEGWISQRTGHMTSEELRGYQRAANTFAELNAGEFAPLDLAIPELRCAAVSDDVPGHSLASVPAKSAQPLETLHSIVELPAVPQALEITKTPAVSAAPVASSPVQSAPVGQTMAGLEARIDALSALVVPPSELAAALSSSIAAAVAAAVAAELRAAKLPSKTAKRKSGR